MSASTRPRRRLQLVWTPSWGGAGTTLLCLGRTCTPAQAPAHLNIRRDLSEMVCQNELLLPAEGASASAATGLLQSVLYLGMASWWPLLSSC